MIFVKLLAGGVIAWVAFVVGILIYDAIRMRIISDRTGIIK